MPLRRMLEVAAPTTLRYAMGAVIMIVGVVFPVGYMMIKNKREGCNSTTPADYFHAHAYAKATAT